MSEFVEIGRLQLWKVVGKNQTVKFFPKLEFTLEFDDSEINGWKFCAITYDVPRFIITGKTFESMMEDLIEQVNFVWEEYVEVDESTLTKNAIELRNYLISSVTRISTQENS